MLYRRLVVIASALLLVAFAATPAYADLIEIDLVSSGDGLVTRDTVTGLEWLDLTETLDKSFSDVTCGSFYSTYGFTHATQAQVETLFLGAAVGATLNLDSGSFNTVPNGTAAEKLLGLLGQTDTLGAHLYGQAITVDGPGNSYWAPWYGKESGSTLGQLATGTIAGTTDGSAIPFVGHWLVRSTPVPEPTTAALLALGLLLVFGRARRLRRAGRSVVSTNG